MPKKAVTCVKDSERTELLKGQWAGSAGGTSQKKSLPMNFIPEMQNKRKEKQNKQKTLLPSLRDEIEDGPIG